METVELWVRKLNSELDLTELRKAADSGDNSPQVHHY